MEITEFEKKRAANLIWNGARDYTVDTGFRVYDFDGHAQLYWNSIVGAIHLHYDWAELMQFYRTFEETVYQTLYESLFWIAMENCTYQREASQRPVLPYLRRQYALHEIRHHALGVSDDNSAVVRSVSILLGHLHHILGQPDNIPDLVDANLLREIELGPELDTTEIIRSLTRTLEHYTTWRNPATHGGRNEILPRITVLQRFRRRKQKDGTEHGPVRRLAFGYGEHAYEYGSEVLDQSHLSVAFANYTAQTDEGLKQYITDYFGKSSCSGKETAAREKAYCQGSHKDVRLYFTRGSYDPATLEHGFAGKQHKLALEQAKRNREAYLAMEARHRLQIQRLTQRIRNSLLTHLDDQQIRTNAGTLVPRKIWRALYVEDDRIFEKTIPGDPGNLTVDLLLDASSSQMHRTQVVSAQGYMIAEALTNVGIPVRVASFCSMSGYTILRLFRDYEERDKNKEIFQYFTTGANRDGLAVRVAAGLMKNNHAEHRILIVLSDCQPNDVIKVRSGSGQYLDYAGSLAVQDTAAEVHAARMQGIDVLCIFTGSDNNVPDVRRIYGSDFVRIRSLDMFADAVGTLIQQRIRLL